MIDLSLLKKISLLKKNIELTYEISLLKKIINYSI